MYDTCTFCFLAYNHIMKIKFSRRVIVTIISTTILFVYVNLVTPNIEKPLSIAGFYFSLGLALNSWIYLMLRWGGRVSSPMYKSSLFTLAGLYMLALNSINTLDWLDVLVVLVVVGLVIQIISIKSTRS